MESDDKTAKETTLGRLIKPLLGCTMYTTSRPFSHIYLTSIKPILRVNNLNARTRTRKSDSSGDSAEVGGPLYLKVTDRSVAGFHTVPSSLPGSLIPPSSAKPRPLRVPFRAAPSHRCDSLFPGSHTSTTPPKVDKFPQWLLTQLPLSSGATSRCCFHSHPGSRTDCLVALLTPACY